MKMKVLLVLAAIYWQCSLADDDLTVEVAGGKVQGTTIKSATGKEFYVWRGIPFAKPPLGNLRFQPPVDPDPWSGVLNTFSDKKACIQGISDAYSEDCLYINVYTPKKPKTNGTLPVLYWIYGGSYVVGSSRFKDYDPTNFLEEDVIYVSANYRLGVLGFLSLEDSVLPGNAGLKDQLAALKWTKNNIARFGGNPEDITVFGESAGAISLGFHLVSPLSKNLYKAAIMESGTGLANLLTNQGARSAAVRLSKLVNSSISESTPSAQILSLLQSLDTATLNRLATQQFHPVMEVEEGNPMPLLPKSRPIYEVLKAGDYNRVPIIIGVNAQESLFFLGNNMTNAEEIAAQRDNNHLLLMPVMNLKNGVTQQQVVDEIYKEYAGQSTFASNLCNYAKWLSQQVFQRSAIKHAQLQSQFQHAYFYWFSFEGTPSSRNLNIPGCSKVSHGDEVNYIFNNNPLGTEADHVTRQRMVKLWTNFAKFKNPTPNDSSASILQNVTWQPLDATNLQYLEIGDNLQMKSQLLADKTKFWDCLWDKYATHPYNTF